MKITIPFLERNKNLAVRRSGAVLRFCLRRWPLFLAASLLVFLASVLRTLERDGREIFETQKGALILEVFARTELKPQYFQLLEEELRAAEGVQGVTSVSPEAGQARIAADAALSAESQWLQQKMAELNGRNTILPWTYYLQLERWDEPFVSALVSRIEALEVGFPKMKAVAEVHYDRERWALVFSAWNYLAWLRKVRHILVLLFCLAFAFSAGGLFFIPSAGERDLRRWSGELKARLLQGGGGFLWLGLFAGAAGHLLYLYSLGSSFFAGVPSWQAEFGRLFLLRLAAGLCLAVVAALLNEPERDGDGG